MVSLEQYIRESSKNDTAFAEILVEELQLQYSEVLALPSRDLVLSVAGEYGITFGGSSEPAVQVSLEKLFPLKGAALQIDLGSARLGQREGWRNELGIVYSLDLVRNAFGRSQSMLKQIVGIENEVARYQIIQAYESYLAALIEAYYVWVRSYEEVIVAEASCVEAGKLLENVKKKKARYIAYQSEVDKAHLQLIDKEDRLREAQAAFVKGSIRIAYSMGRPLDAAIVPDSTGVYLNFTEGAEEKTASLSFDSTRTGQIYTMLYSRDSLHIARAVDNLLPALSAYIGLGYSDNHAWFVDNTKAMVGVNFSLPFKKSKETAEVEMARIDQKKRRLKAGTLRGRMQMEITQLHTAIVSQKKAVQLAEQRLALADSIHQAEAEDYLYGRTRLNELIQALNTLQNNRLTMARTRIDLARLRLETMDLLDHLVKETEIDSLRN